MRSSSSRARFKIALLDFSVILPQPTSSPGAVVMSQTTFALGGDVVPCQVWTKQRPTNLATFVDSLDSTPKSSRSFEIPWSSCGEPARSTARRGPVHVPVYDAF